MESTVARWHVQGWNVAFRDGYVVFDDRILNAEIIKRLPQCPDTVVLGSSRCMQLRSEYFPGRIFFNHAMRRAVLEDLVAVWQLYRRRGWKPRRVMLGVDAWLLDGGYWKSYWQPLREAFDEIRSDWKLPPASTSAANDANEIPGINRWKRVVAGVTAPLGWQFFKTREDGMVELVRRKDGSVSYHAAFRERPAAEVSETIRKSEKFPHHPLAPEMKDLLTQFVMKLRSEDVEVCFVIPPYHPVFWQLRGKNDSGTLIKGYDDYLTTMTEVERAIRTLAERNHARVIGGFDPEAFRANEGEFYDWMHPKPQVFERLLRNSC